MPIDYKNNHFLSTIYYFIPCNLINSTITFQELLANYSFVEDNKRKQYIRHLIRPNVKTCINEINLYSLKNKDNMRPIFGFNIINYNNFSLILNNILLCKINNNYLLILECGNKINDLSLNICDFVASHVKLINSYFKNNSNNLLTNNEEILNIKIDNIKELTISELGYNLGFNFDFNSFPIMYLSQIALLDKNINKEQILEQISNGTINIKDSYFKDNIKYINQAITKSSNFGNCIIYELDKDDININKKNIENLSLLKNEFFYDFIIAMNYKIMLEKQLLYLSTIKWDDSNSLEYKDVLDKAQEQQKALAKYYFLHISFNDYVNIWYYDIFDKFYIKDLNTELELKYQNTITYLKNRIDNQIEIENKGINAFTTISQIVANTALFILTIFEVFSGLTIGFTWNVIVALCISITILVIIIISQIILYNRKKKIKIKYNN